MELLQGSIAFALALAGLASVCTVLIEILHRVAGLRAKGLRLMLEAYFDQVLRPRLGEVDTAALRADLIDKLTRNVLLERLHPSSTGGQVLGGLYRRRLLQATSVSLEDFLKRLPESEVFRKIEARTQVEAQQILQQLADRYEEYGEAARDYFKRRAQLLSLLMGIALALVANIQAVRIFDTFVKNPDLAARMAAQADKIETTLEQARGTNTTDDLANIQADFKQVSANLKAYEAFGLPIGWRYYPNCFGLGAGDPDCNAVRDAAAGKSKDEAVCTFSSICKTFSNDPAGAVLWVLTVIITGILIGLGGPFWFDLAMRLTQLKQALGGGTATPAPRQNAIDTAATRLAPAVPAPSVPATAPWDDKPW